MGVGALWVLFGGKSGADEDDDETAAAGAVEIEEKRVAAAAALGVGSALRIESCFGSPAVVEEGDWDWGRNAWWEDLSVAVAVAAVAIIRASSVSLSLSLSQSLFTRLSSCSVSFTSPDLQR